MPSKLEKNQTDPTCDHLAQGYGDIMQEYENVTVEEYYAILAAQNADGVQNGGVQNGVSKKKPFYKRIFGKKNKDTVDSAPLPPISQPPIQKTVPAQKAKMPSSNPLIQFVNCRILSDHKIVREDLWVRNGKICNPEKLFFDEQVGADVVLDCQNAIIAPGFIDVQINGAFGVDFSYVSKDLAEGIKKVSKGLLPHGVTSYCPTVITSSLDAYKKILPNFKKTNGSKEGAGILGLHLEGPFLNPEKRGMHPLQMIRPLDGGMQDLFQVYDGSLDEVAMLTLAPELENSDCVITELVKRNITVSLGHSMASLSQGEEAVKLGASFITHLFNAMLPFHHRDPHLVGLLASDQIPEGRTVYYGMISDGIHTHPAALRIAHRTHSAGIVLVTDAIPSMGLPVGIHHFGPQAVEIKGNRAVIAGTDTLCGSIATLNECIKHFLEATGCSVVEALEAATLHPAEALNITNSKGTLEYDSDADLVFLDDELNVKKTYIAGELVWSQS